MSATAKGTKSYFASLSTVSSSILGKTGLRVSRVGFGGYRIHERSPQHREALELALRSGCNLIDTSTNYVDGSSERLIGITLNDLFKSGELKREQIVIVSKAGYVQGSNLALARSRLQEGRPFPEMIEYHPECWHCISPEFLEDQITRSLSRLKLESLDILLLHNPEYYLKTQPHHGEYYRRIEVALSHLEKEAARGRIQHYGISSNSFVEPKESPEFTSLDTVLDIAERISPKNRFSVIQFPFNLLECGAVVENNNGHRTVTELAESRKLGTLANRPLNAYAGRELIRLADFQAGDLPNAKRALETALAAALHQESALPESGSPRLPTWAKVISDHRKEIDQILQWREIVSYQVQPFLNSLTELPQKTYREALVATVNAMTDLLEAREAARSEKISEALNRHCPSLKPVPHLSQKVVKLLSSFPGISCVLVGMRLPAYVTDILAATQPLSTSEAFEALNAVSELVETQSLGVTPS